MFALQTRYVAFGNEFVGVPGSSRPTVFEKERMPNGLSALPSFIICNLSFVILKACHFRDTLYLFVI